MSSRPNGRRFLAALMAAATVTIAIPEPADAHNVKRVKKQIRRAWHGNDKRAIRVAKCESSLNPKATSPSGKYLGLWQFDRTTWNEYGGPGNDPRKVNAARQTRVAWRLFKHRGWAPWPTCGAGKAASTADAGLRGPSNTDTRRRK